MAIFPNGLRRRSQAQSSRQHDVQEHNVILIGSSFQNDAVAQLSSTGQDFIYQLPQINDELWNGSIVNRHPLPAEAPFYKTERDKVTQPSRKTTPSSPSRPESFRAATSLSSGDRHFRLFRRNGISQLRIRYG